MKLEEIMDEIRNNCDYKNGHLPSCAPLGVAYVPMQQSSKPAYEHNKALTRGTLFPGLDLPFMNIVNQTDYSNTPLGELMALEFVLDELELYLDTHTNDSEAFETYQEVLMLTEEGRRLFAEKFGPISQKEQLGMKRYKWTDDPWPWEYNESGERRGD